MVVIETESYLGLLATPSRLLRLARSRRLLHGLLPLRAVVVPETGGEKVRISSGYAAEACCLSEMSETVVPDGDRQTVGERRHHL